MDLTIKRTDLSKAISLCAHASAAKESPSSGLVLLKPLGSTKLRLFSCDTILSVDAQAPLLSLDADGAAQAVDVKRLGAIASNLGETIRIRMQGDRLIFRDEGGKRRYSLSCMDPRVIPSLREPSTESHEATIPSEALARIIRRAEHSTETSLARPALDGIQLHANANLDVLVGVGFTNHKIVVTEEVTVVHGSSLPLKTFLPRALIGPLKGMLNEGSSVKLHFDDRTIWAQVGDVLLNSNLPSGNPPSHEQFLSMFEPTEICEISSSVMMREALKAIEAGRTSRDSCVRLRFDGSSTIALDLVDDESQASDEITCIAKSREPFEFCCNPTYVLDHLKAADARMTLYNMSSNGSDGPVCFRSEDGYQGYLAKMNPKGSAVRTSAADVGPGKGRKKKASAKKSAPPPDDEDDELGSADPSNYV